MDNINIQIYENGFQSNAYNNPQIQIYIRKGNLSIFNYSFNPHWHRDLEIIRVINGSMKYNIDGQVTELHKDDVLFVNSDRMHFGYSDSKMECNYVCLVFDYGLLCSNTYIQDNYILNIVNDEYYPYVVIKNKNLNKVIDDLYSCRDCLSYDLKVQSYLYDIFSYIFEAFMQSPKNKIEKKNFSKIRNR